MNNTATLKKNPRHHSTDHVFLNPNVHALPKKIKADVPRTFPPEPSPGSSEPAAPQGAHPVSESTSPEEGVSQLGRHQRTSPPRIKLKEPRVEGRDHTHTMRHAVEYEKLKIEYYIEAAHKSVLSKGVEPFLVP